MTVQFLHLETYGRTPKRGAKRHETVSGILGEASRRPSSSFHIATVREPARLFGPDPLDLAGKITVLSELARDSAGRRLRPDAGLLVAVVISYPVSWTKLEDEDGQSCYLDWREQTRRWLIATFGQSLESIVEHTDERFPHLHAFLVPGLTDTMQVDWTNAHPGRAAKVASARRLEAPAAQDAAYQAAMSALADDFHHQVSNRFAHARVRVRRNRRSRLHHLEIARLEARIANLEQENAELARALSPLRAEALHHQAQELRKAGPQAARSYGALPPAPVFPPDLESAGDPWHGVELEVDDSPLPEDMNPVANDGSDDPDPWTNYDHDDPVAGESDDDFSEDDFSWDNDGYDPPDDDDPGKE